MARKREPRKLRRKKLSRSWSKSRLENYPKETVLLLKEGFLFIAKNMSGYFQLKREQITCDNTPKETSEKFTIAICRCIEIICVAHWRFLNSNQNQFKYFLDNKWRQAKPDRRNYKKAFLDIFQNRFSKVMNFISHHFWSSDRIWKSEIMFGMKRFVQTSLNWRELKNNFRSLQSDQS